ncbi:MAG: hypothetical protein JOZ78_04010 [Chroococcidiopsidaceae cyanobacterium CP_BM_ER_R8_30]|nr:hypothetical protein [Chroococcidiopsidaceae cyanobacterium CP_BM_ER_R8_30]
MQRLILSSLSVLLLTIAAAPVVGAQTKALNSETSDSTNSYQLTPFNLVSLAYQGNFKQQGIPSAGALVFAYEDGQVSATKLVRSAIADNQLLPSALDDRGYLKAVKFQLDQLLYDQRHS